ncbi:MAG: hypothetical protein EOP60_07620 [Sphingomonadales bacterium]|nr:MAG: hypothetical protein EOP60_07620 [Sphingomonadales bacterium]
MWDKLFGRKKAIAPESSVTAPFEPRNELEIALIAAAREPAARAAFERLLLGSDLYAATPEAPAQPSEHIAGEGKTISILNVAGPDGAPVPALFTAESRLAEIFGVGTGYVRLPATAFFEMFGQSGVFLNPGQSYAVTWSAEDLSHLLGKPVRRTVAKDTKILLGSPAQRPDALIARIRETVADAPALEEVWLALAHWPDDGQASWYLDVHSSADPDEVAELLADVLRAGPFDGKALDLIVNPPDAQPGTGIRIKPAELH